MTEYIETPDTCNVRITRTVKTSRTGKVSAVLHVDNVAPDGTVLHSATQGGKIALRATHGGSYYSYARGRWVVFTFRVGAAGAASDARRFSDDGIGIAVPVGGDAPVA